MSKLIIIRGNSGSGKSSTAKELRKCLGTNTALIEQDYLRRILLKEKDKPDQTVILGLVRQTVLYCLENDYDVILEGIFATDKYRDMLVRMIDHAAQKGHRTFTFYLDVSLEETLRRHKTKREACEFGEDKLRRWYREKDYLNIREEVIIPETFSLEESIERITELTK